MIYRLGVSPRRDVGPDDDVVHRASAGAVGSMQALWKDQRETEPSVTES